MLSLEDLLFFQWMEEQEKEKSQEQGQNTDNNGE